MHVRCAHTHTSNSGFVIHSSDIDILDDKIDVERQCIR